MEILGIETCLSAKVHFLITKVGKDKLNERSFSLTPEGCIDWEKACSYLPGNVYERIFDEGKKYEFIKWQIKWACFEFSNTVRKFILILCNKNSSEAALLSGIRSLVRQLYSPKAR